jgi:hypothetical protein
MTAKEITITMTLEELETLIEEVIERKEREERAYEDYNY